MPIYCLIYFIEIVFIPCNPDGSELPDAERFTERQWAKVTKRLFHIDKS